jgi:hypothetical protein
VLIEQAFDTAPKGLLASTDQPCHPVFSFTSNREISLSGKIIHCTTPESAFDALVYQHQSAHFASVFSQA